jgi:fructose-1-phosphate kinase PfkB-like protein
VILTVTLNAAIDRTVAVPNFRLGQRHRAVEARTMAGGKGVNIARALRLLGRPVIAAGMAGGGSGTRLLQQLRDESVLTAFTRIAGETRTNLAVIDPTTGEQTEINDRGPEVSARLVAELRTAGVLTVLDADGEQMRAGLRAGPAVVAPNVGEAEEAVGHEFNEIDDFRSGLSILLEMGAGEAIITSETLRRDRRRWRRAPQLRGADRPARAGHHRGVRRLLPGRVRRRPLRGGERPRLPRVRRRLRRRVDPALRRRHARPPRSRAPAPPRGRERACGPR